ncbi:MAG: Trm112 family protein [Neisseria sp.]|nr:Trm112 family protein [Neisseria sp.]
MEQKFLDVLVCPLTKSKLEYRADKQELWSREAGLAYPIKDGIPFMLVTEARELDEEELA